MPAIALPAIPPLVEGILWVGGLVIGAILLAAIADRISDYISDHLGDAIAKARECRNCQCPDCVPPKGTVGIRIDWVPPSVPHWPCPGSHVHFYIQSQNPTNCQCFWSPQKRNVLCLDPKDTPADFDPRKLGPNIHVLP